MHSSVKNMFSGTLRLYVMQVNVQRAEDIFIACIANFVFLYLK